MRTGRPVAKIELSAEVAGILEGYTQRRKTAQALALRARIVLADDGQILIDKSNALAARRRLALPDMDCRQDTGCLRDKGSLPDTGIARDMASVRETEPQSARRPRTPAQVPGLWTST